MKRYIPRVIDAKLEKLLGIMPAVVIEGPKYSGKTETARQFSDSEVLFDVDQNARLLGEINPAGLLDGDTPRLLDEWQIVPEIWNHVRRECDSRNQSGQFILTGTTFPSESTIRHSGAGRLTRLHMRPMSLYEQGMSNGTVSLNGMLTGDEINVSKPSVTFAEVVQSICHGGWPSMHQLSLDSALEYNRAYLNEISRAELPGARSNFASRSRRLLSSIARNVATSVSMTTLRDDVDASALVNTISGYIELLEDMHVVEQQMPFLLHLRSRSQLRVTPKRHLCDPCLAVAATRSSPQKLLNDVPFLGLLFESMVFRDLSVYAEANDAKVYFYRDNTGLEVDSVVETVDGEWIAVEVKLGGEKAIESAVQNLYKFKKRIDSAQHQPPQKLLIVTATPEFSYERPDGIAVVPLSCLRP